MFNYIFSIYGYWQVIRGWEERTEILMPGGDGGGGGGVCVCVCGSVVVVVEQLSYGSDTVN